MKCFVINLKRATKRKKYISNQLNLVSQEFEVIEGIDWQVIDQSLQSKTAKNIKIKNSFRTLTPGQIGCNLSHRKILKWLVNSSENMIAVLEDDIRLSKEFPEVLNALEKSHQEFDIVFLGSRFPPPKLVNLVPLNDKFNFALSKSRDKGTWGYVITKSAAQKFLSFIPEITGPIDDALHAYYLHGLKTFTLNPQVVYHEGEEKRVSFVTEKKLESLILTEEVLRFVSMFFEFYIHRINFRKRVNSEKN